MKTTQPLDQVRSIAASTLNRTAKVRKNFESFFIKTMILTFTKCGEVEVGCLVPKSVTTPIAIEVSQKIGGIPSLTAAIVVCVGLLGGILGFKMLTLGHIGSPVARSLSMGTAAHVIGTSRASEFGDRYSAFATLGLILNGVLTALLAGPLVDLLL